MSALTLPARTRMTHGGRFYRYCALCDTFYPEGTFRTHRLGAAHVACLRDRRAMARWYEANGS